MLRDGPNRRIVGSTAAWFNDSWQGGGWGRIHWVGVAQDYQGRGLAEIWVESMEGKGICFSFSCILEIPTEEGT